MSQTLTSVAIVPSASFPIRPLATSPYLPLVCLYGFFFGVTTLSAIAFVLGSRYGRRAEWNRSIVLLQQCGTLERIFHKRYRSQDESEDYRSG